MEAESRTKEALIYNRARVKTATQDIKRLFMDMAAVDLDPEDRILNAIAKITTAQECIEAFRRRYPKEQYPAERFRKVYDLIVGLEIACEKAEYRMERFEERRSAGINRSSFN